MKYPFIVAAALLCLGACRQATTQTGSQKHASAQPPSPAVTTKADSRLVAAADSTAAKPDFRAMNAMLRGMRPASSAYLVSGTAPQTITGDKGIRLRIVPAALETVDGQPVSGPIEVSMTEMGKAADFILNGAPTMSGGQLLVSGGAVELRCTAGGKELRIKKGQTMEISFPRKAETGMRLFYGQRAANGIVNWVADSGKAPAAVAASAAGGRRREERPDTARTVPAAGQPAMMANSDQGRDFTVRSGNMPEGIGMDSAALRPYLMGKSGFHRASCFGGYIASPAPFTDEGYDVLRISRLGYINCDRFYTQPMTELAVTAPAGERGKMMRSFFILKSMNSVLAKDFYFNAEGIGPQIVRLPQGMPVRMVSLLYEGARIYAFSKELVPGQDAYVQVKLSAVSKEEVERLIAGKS